MRTKQTEESLVEQIRSTAKKKVEPRKDFGKVPLIPTGSTLLNLACSDNPFGGFAGGEVVNLIGDKSSGKTFLFLTMLAEISQRKKFDEYQLVYDSVETTMHFDIPYLFGKRLAKRIESPMEDENGDECGSATIQDFHSCIQDLNSQKKSIVYGLDSFDALSSDEELVRAEEALKARDKGGKKAGSFNTEKTRGLSAMFRQIAQGIERTNSLLVIISQVRENLSNMPFVPKYVRAGGRALGHYSGHEIWMGVTKKIKRDGRVIGVECCARVTKNKLTGKIREANFSIYYDYGVDDVGSCVDFLVKEGVWKKRGQTIFAEELGLEETRDNLIKKIEEDGLEDRMKEITGDAWNRIEEELKPDRKRRYQ